MKRWHINDRDFAFRTLIAVLFVLFDKVDATTKTVVEFKTDFASDPKISTFKENFIQIPAKNIVSLQSFTYCFRIELFSTIVQFLFLEGDDLGFKFQTKNFGFVIVHGAWIMFECEEQLVPLKWYHVCMSYESGHILLVMNDKTLINKEYSYLKSLKDSKWSLHDGLRLGIGLGNGMGNDGPLDSILRGRVVDFNMWSKSLSLTDLRSFVRDCLPLPTHPDVIIWDSLEKVRKGGNVDILQLTVDEICGKKSSHSAYNTIITIPIKMTYESSKRLCTNLGGNLAMFRNDEDIVSLNRSIALQITSGNEKSVNLMVNTCARYFWVPIRQNGVGNDTKGGEYIWSEDISSQRSVAPYLPWAFSQPNGLEYQQCVQISLMDRWIVDSACNTERCSLCEFHGSVNFHIRGLPETSPIDNHFIFVPQLQTGDSLKFMGHRQYLIRWVYENNVWEMLDRSNLAQTIGSFNNTLSNNPVGIGSWQKIDSKLFGTDNDVNPINLKLSKVKICHNFIMIIYNYKLKHMSIAKSFSKNITIL